MRKLGLLIGILFLASLSAMAQKVDIFGGYSLVNFAPGGGFSSVNFNGGVGSVAYHFTNMFSAVGEVAGYHASPAGVGVTAITYLFGPKASVKVGPVTPFGQVLFGGIHASADNSSADAFAMTFGGGVDWNVTKHFAVRLGQFEDLYTQFGSGSGFTGSGSQNSFRYSTGVVFKL
jgi:opacity protein-like surface antigen